MTAQEEQHLIRTVNLLRKEIGVLKDMLKPHIPKEDKFLNFNQARKELGVSRTKMYSMLSNGELSFATKVGSRWRFSLNAIRAYLANTS